MAGPRYKHDAMSEVMQDWGSWVRGGREALGWGGVQHDAEPMPRAPGTHANPQYRELISTAGEGLYRMIDSRLLEHHSSYRKVLHHRYAEMQGFTEIGRRLKIEPDICRVMHDRSMALLRIEVVRYMLETRDEEAESTYGQRLYDMG